MKMKRFVGQLLGASCAAFFLLGVPGPVNAADGPRVITHCTVINDPGFYVVAKNIVARANDVNGTYPLAGCILIASDFVTLDLGGFLVSSEGNSVNGISVDSPTRQGITVRNGSVVGFGLNGVFLRGRSHIVENVRASGNGFIGFVVGLGTGNIVRNNVAVANGTAGFNAAGSIIGNVATDNPQVGILAICPSLIVQNIAARNGVEVFGAQIVGFEGADPQPCTQLENNPLP